MNYREIDYFKYLSIDNGKGILLRSEDILVLNRYNIDYMKYDNLKDIMIEIDELLEFGYDDQELEELSFRLNELYYYNYVNK